MNNDQHIEKLKSDNNNDDNEAISIDKIKKRNGKVSNKQIITYSVYLIICFIVFYYVTSTTIQCSSLYKINRLLSTQIDALQAEEHDRNLILKDIIEKRLKEEKVKRRYAEAIGEVQLENRALEEKKHNRREEYEKEHNHLIVIRQQNALLQKERDTIDKSLPGIKEELSKYKKQMSELISDIEEAEGNLNINNYNKALSNNKLDKRLGSLFDSFIIQESKQIAQLLKWINYDSFYHVYFTLLYRGSDANFSIQSFHSKCDELTNPLVILIQLNDGSIVGGFTTRNTSGKDFKEDYNAFIFNLSNLTKYSVKDRKKAIYVDDQLMIMFGNNDLSIKGRLMLSKFPESYGFRSDIKHYELTNGIENGTIDEIEVFKIVYID